jgi:hypothetical protein
MFFDPGTKTETKADPLTLPAFIAWLEKQPAEQTYCYFDNGRCLVSQYMSAALGRHIEVDPVSYWDAGTWKSADIFKLPIFFDEVANDIDRTFGAALDRARAMRGES